MNTLTYIRHRKFKDVLKKYGYVYYKKDGGLSKIDEAEEAAPKTLQKAAAAKKRPKSRGESTARNRKLDGDDSDDKLGRGVDDARFGLGERDETAELDNGDAMVEFGKGDARLELIRMRRDNCV